MIYKIFGKDAKTPEQFIIFSVDGTYALVRSDTDIDEYLEKYPESELNSLLNDTLYQQPCKDCEL